MSIRLSLLALLEEGPRYGYQLRAEFETRTGGAWPLNVGQVYSTLARLERDGLVVPVATAADEAQVHYGITDTGRAAVADWFRTPVERTTPPRDELAIKLALAVTVPGVDVERTIATQRSATLRAMRDYTRLKAQADDDLAWSLVLDSLIFSAEAEIRWLDHCEARLARAAETRPARVVAAPQPVDATAGDAR
jgi:DNA-binding PadR family transcriptional regulator